ncbi:MAG: extradiol ring-cleavage dioxygenase [Dehalococcoidia bacterium]
MGEILCVGASHFPGFAYTDDHMADILRRHLLSDRVPAEAKDPKNWPARMLDEFGADGENAEASAAIHRQRVMDGYRKVREEIDAFKPDFVLFWGDDQYENFKEDLVPPFCLFLADEFTSTPWMNGAGWMLSEGVNIFEDPKERKYTFQGEPNGARYLIRRLHEEGFAIPYSYKQLHRESISHAFINSLLYLDYDQKGWDYPIVPFHVNAYGSSVVRNRGGDSLGKEISEPDPPAPSPKLCFDLGAATARILAESPWRVVLFASSSWSHAFLTPKNNFLWPDVEADHQRYEELRDGRQAEWRDLKLSQIEESGQAEILQWVMLAGAMTELNRKPEIIDFTDTYIFNSSKCTLIARPTDVAKKAAPAAQAAAR